MNYNTTIWKVLRWIGIIPTFVVAYVIAYYLIYFSQKFYADSDSWIIKYVTPIIGSAAAGFFSIVYAAKVAPAHHSIVAFTLLILMVLAMGVLIFFSIYNESIVNSIALIASLIGTIAGYFAAKDKETLDEI